MVSYTVKQCPACDSVDYTEILQASDYRISGEIFKIMECSICSLRFTSPIPDKAEIVTYYKSDDYISHADQGGSLINKVYRVIRYFTLRSKKNKMEYFSSKKPGSLLDIGCGIGEFLSIAQRSGWDVAGVETDQNALTIAEKKVGSVIFDRAAIMGNDHKYDVITFWHSLEHIHDLKECLNKAILSLKSEGIIIIAVPNYKSYDSEYYRQAWAAYDVPRHLYHFSYNALIKLVERTNLKHIHSSQLPFDPFYIALLSETVVKGKRNILKALYIGWRSYRKGKKDIQNCSSILLIFKKDHSA